MDDLMRVYVKEALDGDPVAADALEEEIGRRDQLTRGRYVWALCAQVGIRQVSLSAIEMFMLIRATPEQRARAFIEAVA